MGLFSGLFGDSDSSSSSTTTTNTTNVDKRLVVDTGSVGVSSDSSTVNVTQTDQGSILGALSLASQTVEAARSAAIDLAKTSTEAQGNVLGSVLGFADKALMLTKENINLAIKNTDQIGTAYKTVGDLSTGNRTLATLGLIVGGIVAVIAFSGGKWKV